MCTADGRRGPAGCRRNHACGAAPPPHLRRAGQQDAAGGLLLSLRHLGQHQVALGHHLRKQVRAGGMSKRAALPPVSGVPPPPLATAGSHGGAPCLGDGVGQDQRAGCLHAQRPASGPGAGGRGEGRPGGGARCCGHGCWWLVLRNVQRWWAGRCCSATLQLGLLCWAC